MICVWKPFLLTVENYRNMEFSQGQVPSWYKPGQLCNGARLTYASWEFDPLFITEHFCTTKLCNRSAPGQLFAALLVTEDQKAQSGGLTTDLGVRNCWVLIIALLPNYFWLELFLNTQLFPTTPSSFWTAKPIHTNHLFQLNILPCFP